MKPTNIFITPGARDFLDNASGQNKKEEREAPEIQEKEQPTREARQSSHTVLLRLNRAKRNDIYDAITENIEDPLILDIYRQIILDRKPLSSIPAEHVEAFFEDLEASPAAQEIILHGSPSAQKPSMQAERAVYPAGRMVPPKPSLHDYDMTRDLSIQHRANYGIWKDEDDHGE